VRAQAGLQLDHRFVHAPERHHADGVLHREALIVGQRTSPRPKTSSDFFQSPRRPYALPTMTWKFGGSIGVLRQERGADVRRLAIVRRGVERQRQTVEDLGILRLDLAHLLEELDGGDVVTGLLELDAASIRAEGASSARSGRAVPTISTIAVIPHTRWRIDGPPDPTNLQLRSEKGQRPYNRSRRGHFSNATSGISGIAGALLLAAAAASGPSIRQLIAEDQWSEALTQAQELCRTDPGPASLAVLGGSALPRGTHRRRR
jgi:hypothetical protein